MNLNDYILDHSKVDWPNVLRDWLWLIPDHLTVWIMNRFGDLFVVLDDGTIHMLEIGGGRITKIAESRDDFADKIDGGENANQWLMIPLVDKLVSAGVRLSKGTCYGYRIPPVIGGDYTVENTAVVSIPEHYSFHADIHQQIKNVPDGAKVVLKIKKKGT
jgi:hypothetical protein